MTPKSKSILIAHACLILTTSNLGATKPGPEKRWASVGKSLHRTYRAEERLERSHHCRNACRKKGAKRQVDLGACEESCVFG